MTTKQNKSYNKKPQTTPWNSLMESNSGRPWKEVMVPEVGEMAHASMASTPFLTSLACVFLRDGSEPAVLNWPCHRIR